VGEKKGGGLYLSKRQIFFVHGFDARLKVNRFARWQHNSTKIKPVLVSMQLPSPGSKLDVHSKVRNKE
jgi:hypothetical protein